MNKDDLMGEKTVTIKTIHIGKYELEAVEVLGCLEELEDCDGLFSAMVFYDIDMENALMDIGIIKRNAKGSCYTANEDKRLSLISTIESFLWGD